MVKSRDDILREEFGKTALESALYKMQSGDVLRLDHVTEELADFLRRYDWIIVFWPAPRNPSGIGASIVRDSGKEQALAAASLLCASIARRGLNYTPCAVVPIIIPPEPPEPVASNAICDWYA
jgi:hypothetical protein